MSISIWLLSIASQVLLYFNFQFTVLVFVLVVHCNVQFLCGCLNLNVSSVATPEQNLCTLLEYWTELLKSISRYYNLLYFMGPWCKHL